MPIAAPGRYRTFAFAARGFGLIELMVAVAISMLLLSGVVAIFVSSKSSYETNERFSRIQENGRFALDAVITDLRSSGFVGCARQPNYLSTSLNNSTALQWDFLAGPIAGFEATGTDTWAPSMDASITTPLSGSDVIAVRVPVRDRIAMPLTLNMANSSANLRVAAGAGTTGVRAGDIALAYSCEAISVFQVTNYSDTTGVISHAVPGVNAPGNASLNLNYTYRQAVTQVIPVETVVYFIAPSTRVADAVDPAAAGTTSLWRRRGLGATEELVEGIEQMQLRYGVDTTGDVIVDEYRTADAVTDWNDVISVSVAMLVRSLEEYGTEADARTYTLLDVDVAAPADRRMREVFTATASIRNRVRVN